MKTALLTRSSITLIFPSENRYCLNAGQWEYLEFALVKAGKIPAGARWITVRPNGPGTEGQPVLIQENPDGSAHVIGGAGGKLNYLKLRHVRSESEYKREAQERKKKRVQQRKEQRERDKAAGIVQSKQAARENLKMQRLEHEREFVRTVARAMGWDESALTFPEKDYEQLSEAAQNKLRTKHHNELVGKANKAVELQRQMLVSDAQARLDAGIGEIALDDPDPEKISVDDLNPISQNTAGLGFATDYRGRAEEQGLTPEELQAEASELKKEKQRDLSDSQRQAIIRRGETAKLVKAELANIRGPDTVDVAGQLAQAKQAVELLKAQKRLKAIHKQARDAAAEIEKTASEPKAYVLEYTTDDEDSIREDLVNDLRVTQTQAFLAEFERLAGPNAQDTLGAQISLGAYNSVNSLALSVGGAALVDRSVVDVLGIAGAAQVLARRIHTDLADHAQDIAAGMQDFHVNHYMGLSQEAMSQAQELMQAAREIEIGQAANGAELRVAQELNAKRIEAIGTAQKVLGRALGEMEANAALVVALKQGKKDDFQVSLGKVGIEDAIRRVRAIGLQRGDYKIESVAGDTFLIVNGNGLDRLSKPIQREDIEQIQRNLSIMSGDFDEDGWLPLGVANRPDLSLDVKPGVAPSLARSFEPGEDLVQALRDYIGGRAADGDAPADIVADIQSAEFFQKVGAGRIGQYHQALNEVAPLKDDAGKQQRAESLAGRFDEYADQFVQSHYGGERSTLNRQKFVVDQNSVDALHRALSETPEGVAAYKQLGELSSSDQRALREYFYRNVAKESPEEADLRAQLDDIERNEPQRETEDMFGEAMVNPQWHSWRQSRDEMAAKVNAASLSWPKYVDIMRGNEKAYEAIQDLIRSKISHKFVETYNTLNAQAPIKLGKAVIRNNLNHLDATDPQARDKRVASERALIDSLRNRVQGRYASGAVADKLDAARDEKEAFSQAQMGFFSMQDDLYGENGREIKLAGDERYSLGHAAERQIAAMMGKVGQNFRPGQPLRIWSPTMSGGKNYARQRLVKLVEANKRVMAAFGTGSGKSLLMLASFTHLHEQGKVKRGLYLVPSIVQGEFSGESLRYLEPGKYNWHIEPGASREQRIAAYKDPSKHFAVMTHQAFRDDMLYLGAKQAGVSEPEMSDRLNAMTDAERRDWMRGILDAEGINFDFLSVDESQFTLNRAGKENSRLANVIDSFSAHTPYFVMATGDPVKNDASEIHDLMKKMDPERYADRKAFLRRYGPDTLASKEALRREMARYVYPSRIDPDVHADRQQVRFDLSEGQKKALQDLDESFSRARIARMQGRVDVDAMRTISPSSFEGVAEDQHEALARDLQKSLGIMKSTAVQRVINLHPDNPNVDRLSEMAAERKGKPGVVFARNLEAVRMIAQRLEKDGHRVITLTGADSSEEKQRKRRKFHPESGEPEADILVASDAGATGMNIQRGRWLYQYDVPQTAMVHAQRNGRIFRTGQKNDVELLDAIANHPEIDRARDRLQRKYGLRELMTDPMDGLDDTGVAHFIRRRELATRDSQRIMF